MNSIDTFSIEIIQRKTPSAVPLLIEMKNQYQINHKRRKNLNYMSLTQINKNKFAEVYPKAYKTDNSKLLT